MPYSELAYFDGYHFAHIAAYEETRRLQRIRNQARRAVERRRNPR